jgi:hypothetical protein
MSRGESAVFCPSRHAFVKTTIWGHTLDCGPRLLLSAELHEWRGGGLSDVRPKIGMEDVEKTRRDDMHNMLLEMCMCPELSKEAALDIGVGSIDIGVRFCTDGATRARVRREAKSVVPKRGLRSQGPDAASLPGLGASPPADLLSVVATATGGKRGADANVERRTDGALYTA